MIDKFNFYDIYGYFVPGAVLLAVLWIPIGLVRHKWPSSDWTSAVIAAVIAYVLGHLLQNVATNAIPSQRGKGKQRFPSDYFLDPKDSELPTAVKAKIAELVDSQFELDLEIDKEGSGQDKSGTTTIDKVRNNAFRLARQVLIQGKAVSYAEQFQGMYALTRGLFAVFALAFAYWLGWFFAFENLRILLGIALSLIVAAVPVLVSIVILRDKVSTSGNKHKFELSYAWALGIAVLALGYVAGILYHISLRDSTIVAFLAACAFLACFRLKGAYDNFAALFASTVWRDYLAYNVTQKPPFTKDK